MQPNLVRVRELGFKAGLEDAAARVAEPVVVQIRNVGEVGVGHVGIRRVVLGNRVLEVPGTNYTMLTYTSFTYMRMCIHVHVHVHVASMEV